MNDLATAVQLFHRAARLGDGPVAAYWLNAFHDLMDRAEAEGMGLKVNLPVVLEFDTIRCVPNGPSFIDFPRAPLHWGSLFEEPGR